MEKQQQQTGATNVEYDLFSEIHSLLKGNSALEQYIQDAKGTGDKEVETCFQTLHDQNKQHVDKLRKLIEKRIVTKSAYGSDRAAKDTQARQGGKTSGLRRGPGKAGERRVSAGR